MKTKLIDVTNDGFNWGKMLVGMFDHEWDYVSKIGERPLLRSIGMGWNNILVIDLQTREGAIFRPGGLASADLEKTKIWCCPLFEPFLEWLYQQDLSDISKLPDMVNLPNVEPAWAGYRRPGLGNQTVPEQTTHEWF